MRYSNIISVCVVFLTMIIFCGISQAQGPATAELIIEEGPLLTLYGAGTDTSVFGLATISNGSFVWYDDSNSIEEYMDAITLYDESINTPTGSVSLIASSVQMASLLGVPEADASFGGLNVVRGSNDTIYAMLRDFSEATVPEGQDQLAIFRIPNTGGNNFSSVELVADGNRLLINSSLTNCTMDVDPSTTPDTLFFILDDTNNANDTTTNGLYSLPGNANNDTDPTLIVTLGAITDVLGTADVGCESIAVVPGGDIFINDGRSSSMTGSIVRITRSGECSVFLDATDLVANGSAYGCAMDYNEVTGLLALFWEKGATATEGEYDDRIDEYDIVTGEKIGTVITEDELMVLSSNDFDADITSGNISNSFTNDGEYYYNFNTNGTEFLARIVAPIPQPTSTPAPTATPSSHVDVWTIYR